MTSEVPLSAEVAASKAGSTRHYRKFTPPSSLTPDQVRRQTGVLRAACEHLAPSGAAVAFLNAYDQELGGSPLQLALESDDGLLRVEQHLARTLRTDRPDASAVVHS